MNTTARIQHKGQVTIPTRLREQAGLNKGDVVEFTFQGGKIVITPMVVIDRRSFPNADHEYTPEQRRVVDAQLAEGLADIKAGRVYSFSSAKDASAFIEASVAKKKSNSKTTNRKVR